MAYQDPISRVPFFLFVDREAGIDPIASREAGYDVPRMMTFILITPHGHKGDPMEFFAEEFIERKKREVKEGRYDPVWVDEFKRGLEAYREGRTLPRSGTPMLTWERILKSRREQLAQRFPTVEDLAAVPDGSVQDIGMDGRVLRDKARADIQAKKDLSPVVQELADAKEDNRRLSEQLAKLTARLDAMELLDDKPKRGRPAKVD